MARSNHLTNFSLPTWGARKMLSCSNDYNPTRTMPVVDYHDQSSEEDNYIDQNIAVTREKLFRGYRADLGKMREKILKTKVSDDETPPIDVSRSNEDIGERCQQQGMANEPRSERKSTRPRRNLLKKDERLRFCISLSRREIEEDFFAMTGKKPARKPKKRPRSIQTKLDALYPGSLLSEVHPDLYKVNEHL